MEYLVLIFTLGFLAFLLFLLVKFITEVAKKDKPNYLRSLRMFLNYSITFFLCYFIIAIMGITVIAPKEVYFSLSKTNPVLINWIIEMAIELLIISTLVTCVLFFISYWYQNKIEKIKSVRPVFISFLTSLSLILIATILSSLRTYWVWIDDL